MHGPRRRSDPDAALDYFAAINVLRGAPSDYERGTTLF